jgi:hypothetical protein
LLQHIEIDDIQELVLMRNTNSKSILGRTAAASALLLGAAFASQAAMACTLDNWTSFNGAVAAGSPNLGIPGGVARYSGLCGMEVTGAGYVEDENPGGIDRIVARFYVWAGNSSDSVIYEGYGDDNGGTPRFDVEIAGGNIVLTDASTGQFVSQPANSNAWNSVEIDWAQAAGTGVISLAVNGASATENTALSNVGTQLQSVRLGNINGSSGTTYFDAYESRRSTAVGRLVVADSNADSSINGLDIVVLRNEVLGNSLATGQPDCNENGAIDGLDIVCTRNIVLGN